MIHKLNTAVFFLVTFAIMIAFSLSLTFKVNASGDESTEPYGAAPYGSSTYGGGVIAPREGEILIDKMVKNPATGNFVDHLSPTDPKYRPLDIVVFQLKVNNPGDEDLESVEVIDTMPEFVDFMSGPGNFDQGSRQLKFNVEGLKKGETRDFEIKARISHQSALPEGKNVICPVNVVDAKMGDKSDHDESQFCIEKEMIVPQVPEAGAETVLLTVLGSIFSAGIYLRKKAFNS